MITSLTRRAVHSRDSLGLKATSSFQQAARRRALERVYRPCTRSYATVEPKPRKGLVRRVLLPTTLVVAAFYGAGTYASLQNDAFHDFFVEKIPGGESLVSYVDGPSLSNLSTVSKRTIQSGEDAFRGAKSKLVNAAQSTQTAMERELEMKKVKDQTSENINKIKAKTETAVNNAKKEAERKVDVGQKEAKAVTDKIVTKSESLAAEAKEKVGDVKDKVLGGASSAPSSRSRELDATPQPIQKANLPPFEGDIPLGFEAPPGYSGSAPRPREPTTTKTGKDAKSTPPLPLVAPAVSELSTTEPILGELAATIDSLAGFLRDSPKNAGQSPIDNSNAKTVLLTAQSDLQNLGKRIATIKSEEKATLEKKLDEQAKEYSGQFLRAERELHERLDKQENDWKDAFDTERQALVQTYKKKLEAELDTQQEIINERLKEEVIAQGIEMQRRWIREIKLRVEQERGGRLAKLEELESNLKSLERVTLDNEEYLDENLRVNRLWNAIRAASAIADTPRQSMKEGIKALSIAAQKKSTSLGSDDTSTPAPQPELIQLALNTIPSSSVNEGIDSAASLQSWYAERVAPRIKSAALLPDQAGLFSYFASWALSTLLFTRHGFVAGDDVPSVLSRVEVYLNNKDLRGATAELNQLQGWPKVLARDWLEAARRHLEVKQALELTETEARLESLLL